MTLAVCWWAQHALSCAPGVTHLLPAGHALKWLGAGLQPAALAGAALHFQSLPKAALAADGAQERHPCPTRKTLEEKHLWCSSVSLVSSLVSDPLVTVAGGGQLGEMGAQLRLVSLTCP